MKKLSPAFLAIIIFITSTGIVTAVYVKSKRDKIRSLNSAIAETASRRARADSTDAHKNEMLKKLFPVSGQTSKFIEEAYVIAERYGINNISFDYSERKFMDLGTGSILKALPASGILPDTALIDSVKINFISDFKSAAEFIREIQNLERLVAIEKLKVQKADPSLAVEMIVNIYSTEKRDALQ
ncbi:MAG: hypothetical protein HY809_09130 [Nitrospirae bacterium]|nr:hypothetical protein [Nitrospirota bacterium]